jgi:hypothetical protein
MVNRIYDIPHREIWTCLKVIEKCKYVSYASILADGTCIVGNRGGVRGGRGSARQTVGNLGEILGERMGVYSILDRKKRFYLLFII